MRALSLPLECMLGMVSWSGLLWGGGTQAQTTAKNEVCHKSQDAVPDISRSHRGQIALFSPYSSPARVVRTAAGYIGGVRFVIVVFGLSLKSCA